MSILNPAPRQPTSKERELLARFARLEISLTVLCLRFRTMMSVDFGEHGRRLTSRFLPAEPPIRIEKQHIHNALSRRSTGGISERELSDWAAMLLMNDAYDWEGADEEEIAESLNELSARWLLRNPNVKDHE